MTVSVLSLSSALLQTGSGLSSSALSSPRTAPAAGLHGRADYHLRGCVLSCALRAVNVALSLLRCAGGLDEAVTEAVLHAAFLPFGDIKDVSLPLDHGTQKNRGFGFVTFMERRVGWRALCAY